FGAILMRRDKDRESHAGPGFAACVLIDPLYPAVRSILGNGFEGHDFTLRRPQRRQNGKSSKWPQAPVDGRCKSAPPSVSPTRFWTISPSAVIRWTEAENYRKWHTGVLT